MKNKKIKILLVLIIIFILNTILCNVTFAFTPNTSGFENVTANTTTDIIYKIFGAVINIVTIVAAGIALVILIVTGIQYMISTVEKQAEIKKRSHTYALGAVLVFAASTIVNLLYTFIDGSINSAV